MVGSGVILIHHRRDILYAGSSLATQVGRHYSPCQSLYVDNPCSSLDKNRPYSSVKALLSIIYGQRPCDTWLVLRTMGDPWYKVLTRMREHVYTDGWLLSSWIFNNHQHVLDVANGRFPRFITS